MTQKHAKHRIQNQFPIFTEMNRRNVEHRPVPQQSMDRRVGAHGGNQQGTKALHSNRAHDNLGDEQCTRNRGVIGGRNSCRGATGDQ